MLKNRSVGDHVSADDRPRKKLSFRDPEVVATPQSEPTSASPKVVSLSQLMRPHSFSGVIGLGGLSAHGAAPGVSTPCCSAPPSPLQTSNPVQATGSASPTLFTRLLHKRNGNSPTRFATKHQITSEFMQNNGEVNSTNPYSPALKENIKQPIVVRQSPRPERSNKVSGDQGPHGRSALAEPTLKPKPQQQPQKDNVQMTDVHLQEDKTCSDSLENLRLENHAMRVVRTVGQAFEVVHKMAVQNKSPSPEHQNEDSISREGSDGSSDKPKKDGLDSESGQDDLMTLTSDTYNDHISEPPLRPIQLDPLSLPAGSDLMKGVGETFSSPLSEPLPVGDIGSTVGTPLSAHHEMQLLKEQVEQQQQQTQAAVAQVHLLRDQLAAETAARLEAQARTHQLLVHNKELLEHIQQLVLQVRELEIKGHAPRGTSGISMPPSLGDSKSEPFLFYQNPYSSCPRRKAAASSPASSLSSPLPSSTPTPSPTPRGGPGTTVFFPPPPSPSVSSPLIGPLPLSRQQARHLTQADGTRRSPSLQAETDPRTGPSSGERGPQQTFIGALDAFPVGAAARRLPQVPEDTVAVTPSLGATALFAQRAPQNGPITRVASERHFRQDTLAQLQRMAWARHTTK